MEYLLIYLYIATYWNEVFYEKFKKVENINYINRNSFVEKFKRENIMNKMSKEVYELWIC